MWCGFANIFPSLPHCTFFLPFFSLPLNSSISARFIILLSAQCQDCGGSHSPNLSIYPLIFTNAHIHIHTHTHSVTAFSDSRRHHFIWQEEGCRTSELGLFHGGEINILPSFPAPYPPPPVLPEVRPDSPGTCLTWHWGQGVISSHKEDPASLGNQHSRKQECPMRDFPLLERITDREGVWVSFNFTWFCYKTLTEANCWEAGASLWIQQVTIKALALIT